jgi:methylated-DNA-[protein]-cysteine S-methyltransferase
MNYQILDTPIGALRLVSNGARLVKIDFDGRYAECEPDSNTVDPLLARAADQLREYFAGGRKCFDLPLAPAGTPFQRAVWAALEDIPWGETRSYRDIAAAIGRPTAVRAVGAANGRNPLPLVVPCHRVVGSDGSLTGFAGGLAIKRRLLELEGALAAGRDDFRH